MKKRYVFRDFLPIVGEEKVFRLLNCSRDSEAYGMFLEEYEEVRDQIAGAMDALALAALTEDYLYVYLTVGEEVSRISSSYFQEGDYVRGMLADAMSDSLLMEVENQLTADLRQVCAQAGVGVRRRLEAPADLSMETQRTILEETGAAEFGVTLSSGYMFRPVKSSAYLLELTEDAGLFASQHDCSKCPRKDCPLRGRSRKVIRLSHQGKELELPFREGENLLDILRRGGVGLSAPCGGAGTCGKCRIRVLRGSLPITDKDREKLTAKELEQGIRLACRAIPQGTVYVELVSGEEGFSVVTEESRELGENSRQTPEKRDAGEKSPRPERSWGIAIDLGTTTLAFALVGLDSGQVRASWAAVNPQRSYGADVIARIQAANEGKGQELQRTIQGALRQGIRELLREGQGDGAQVEETQVERLVISGNTTMQHLLLGYPCQSLGQAPFTPYDISFREVSCGEVLGEDVLSCPVWILPGISTYVGSDIAAGLMHCGMDESPGISLLLDLGTNGEMALGNREGILVTSTAAGPAFEGGNISCGIGSVPGAICQVSVREGQVSCRTIGDKLPPVGLCGTGVMEAAAEIRRADWMDETGYLEERFSGEVLLAEGEKGTRITFTQKDIREIQLAKSAVRAGMEVLLENHGISWDQVETVYLAGGFGFHVDLDKTIALGMLPEEIRGKIRVMGNTSLKGAVDCLTRTDSKERLERLIRTAREVSLAEDKRFQEYYVEYMYFGEE
ncbi:MAG TPA: DUF4445 domain-containing protein [Candidatus Egerieimonas intestinavium]|uniref:DUF4445 domain-containing protein n=1 Tax=Candidatus Egerieimonas intestinavium TaxID=2840777 RepID=A0A9D1JFF3_9FIRM|nr:DUF4445 domain-containing protein [Candidatus Egerieimonas intestinavium]